MGYNNRAVRLHGAVKEVMARYNGAVPRDTDALSALPGIGRYTSHAIACFAHGRRVPVVDVNIRRVLSRIFRPMKSAGEAVAEKDAWEIARTVLPANAYDWHQALMDFGAMVCTARSPKCPSCPVAGECLSSGPDRERAHRPGRRPEPAHRGIARRIWRGAVVEALRASPETDLDRRASQDRPAVGKGAVREMAERHRRPAGTRRTGLGPARAGTDRRGTRRVSAAPRISAGELTDLHAGRRDAIASRLSDFSAVPRSEYFYELLYCLLTPQSSAVNAGKAIDVLRERGFREGGVRSRRRSWRAGSITSGSTGRRPRGCFLSAGSSRRYPPGSPTGPRPPNCDSGWSATSTGWA